MLSHKGLSITKARIICAFLICHENMSKYKLARDLLRPNYTSVTYIYNKTKE
jgi:hypothetical protein